MKSFLISFVLLMFICWYFLPKTYNQLKYLILDIFILFKIKLKLILKKIRGVMSTTHR